MSAIDWYLCGAILVLIGLWWLGMRSIARLRREVDSVRAVDQSGFDALNARITRDVLEVKQRLINGIGHAAGDTVWVKEVLEDLVDHREQQLRLSIDRELDRMQTELGRSMAVVERNLVEALNNVQTYLKMALRTEPPAAVGPVGDPGAGNLSVTPTSEDYDPGDSSVAAPADVPAEKVVVEELGGAVREVSRDGTWMDLCQICRHAPHGGLEFGTRETVCEFTCGVHGCPAYLELVRRAAARETGDPRRDWGIS